MFQLDVATKGQSLGLLSRRTESKQACLLDYAETEPKA